MAELRNWQLGYLDRFKYGIAGLMGDDRQAVRNAEKITGLLEYAPGVGDAMAGAEAVDAFNEGNYGTAGLLGAAAAVGLVPGVGDAAAQGIKKGIRAYHGSPHNFDKFDMSKIGTGQGQQEYSEGLYAAERENVAKEYRDKLSKNKKGNMYEININAEPEDFIDWDLPFSQQSPKVQAELRPFVESATQRMVDARREMLADLRPLPDGRYAVGKTGMRKLTEAQVREMRNGLDIENEINKMSGRQIIGRALNHLGAVRQGEKGPELRQFMRDKGIAGVKYLDEHSRGANDLYRVFDPQSGEVLTHSINEADAQAAVKRLSKDYNNLQIEPPSKATSNYVVYDDALIEILRKYGIAGLGLLGAGGAAYNAENDGPAPLL